MHRQEYWSRTGPGKAMAILLRKINLKLAKRDIRSVLAVASSGGTVGEEELRRVYQVLSDMPDVNDLFAGYSSSDSRRTMSAQDIVAFFEQAQHREPMDEDRATGIIQRYSTEGSSLTLGEFVEYLHSRENELFEPEHDKVYQDMQAPLAHYFIASSHNTYVSCPAAHQQTLVPCSSRLIDAA